MTLSNEEKALLAELLELIDIYQTELEDICAQRSAIVEVRVTHVWNGVRIPSKRELLERISSLEATLAGMMNSFKETKKKITEINAKLQKSLGE